jgi:hypothetical protein
MIYEKETPSAQLKNEPNQTQFSVGAGFGPLGLVLGILLLGDCTPESHPNYRPVLFFNSVSNLLLLNLRIVF